ncbi:MAG: septation protein A [Gammaproteobacteria bacterium]|nr:septation protein A [Gammaproteobacteria bacterium]
MKLLFDFLPIIFFFIAYQFAGIYVATGVVIVTAILQLGYVRWRHKRIDGLLLASNSLVILLGTITLLFHNDMFIKWKPTVIYWLFAVAFLGSEYLMQGRSLVQRTLDSNIQLPQTVWHRLNIAWVLFFTIMGAVNLFVVYHYSTTTWVDFKLFGTLALTLLFVVLQGIYLFKHINKAADKSNLLP